MLELLMLSLKIQTKKADSVVGGRMVEDEPVMSPAAASLIHPKALPFLAPFDVF